ncbi:MAG: rRNA cytosine-C5-methyltransferase [Paludibacter sp.]|nr:rRNA cytosine-C5-methyltransferase [Paludibacter sp.]
MQLPEAFITRTRAILKEEYPAFENALNETPPVSIRVNTKLDLKPSNEKVAWCEKGHYLAERPLFTADPLLHAGAYYVQEASSMFLYTVVRQIFPNAGKILDLCAAPGGKSTLLAEALPENSLLVSNEIIRSRANILAENLIKWGKSNIVVTNNAPHDFGALQGFFDAVVVDAPCSGEGMFRKDAGAIKEWSVENVKNCVKRQREILMSVWDTLKTDGVLVYSTCTYNREENEENIEWICNELGAEKINIDIQEIEGIVVTDYGYRFYPHKIKGEGFFLSVLQKTSEAPVAKLIKNEIKSVKFVTLNDYPEIRIKNSEEWRFVREENLLKAYKSNNFPDLLTLKKTLRCIECGLTLAEIKGKDIIPSHQFALSLDIDVEKTQKINADYKTAVSYLKKEVIYLQNETKGFKLVCYNDIPIGWVKNVGTRCNNLYPQHWKIRMKL